MKETWFQSIEGSVILVILIISMMVLVWLGWKIGKRRQAKLGREEFSGTKAVITAVFTVTAFILGLNMSMSSSRFEDRKKLIIQEANCLGTVILRTSLYPKPMKDSLTGLLKKYWEARAAYSRARSMDVILEANKNTDKYMYEIWAVASAKGMDLDYRVATSQMIPALNELFDTVNSRWRGELAKVPETLVFMLLLLIACSAFLIGYEYSFSTKIDWVAVVFFCLITSAVFFISIDLDRQRRGLITTDAALTAIYDLESMFPKE